MSDPFADPGSSTAVDWSEHVGALLLLTVHGIEYDISTVHGVTNAVRADIAVLDGPKAGHEYADALVFPKMLQSQLRSRVGSKVLGRLGQGEAKRGQSAPWQLNPATEGDKDIGRRYLAGQMQTPAQPPQGQQQSSGFGGGEPPF